MDDHAKEDWDPMDEWRPDQLPFNEADFNGVARLFPLPNLVLFPSVMQTLHIFEERYRAMMEDAIATDGLIAMAMYEPGWETDYAGRPPLAPYACLGRVMTHHRFSDGRFNLMLLGVRRIRLVEEVQPPQAFRRAKVEILTEVPAAHPVDERAKLIETLDQRLPAGPGGADQLREVLSRDLPLGVLTDLLSYALPLSADLKRELLGQPCVSARARALVGALTGGLLDPAKEEVWSPPAFSEN